jgi:SAM-dependent methyltransferase
MKVTGVDVAPGAIESVRGRARRAGLTIALETSDILRMPFTDRAFDGAVDIGCFHTLPLRLRGGYGREVARVLRPGGRLGLIWAAREYTGAWGPPHRPSLEEVARALEEEFVIARTEFRPAGNWGFASYAAVLERRDRPQPDRR